MGLWLRWRIERGARRWRHPVYAALVLVGLWSSWIEPYWIRVRHTSLSGIPAEAQPLKLALVADIHWGLFFRDRQLDDLVNRLNAMDVDAVIVAGDWTHEPTQDLRAGLRSTRKAGSSTTSSSACSATRSTISARCRKVRPPS